MIDQEPSNDVSLNHPENALVEAKLKPHIETDNAGFKRIVYYRNGVSFMFKGREEMPQCPIMKKSTVTFLGEKPNWIENTKYDEFLSEIAEEQPPDFPTHFLTNKTIIGVLNLALSLEPSCDKAQKLLVKVEKQQYDQDVLEFLDTLLAVNYVNEKTNTYQYSYEHAEALVVLALIGDEEAQAIVEQKAKAYKTLHAEQAEEKQVLIEQEQTGDGYEEQELACVHATNFLPEIKEEGTVVMKTLYDSTNGKGLRNSLHFYLNDIVQAHAFGSWDDSSTFIVAPFTDMSKANGQPEVLYFEDTWWTRNPKQSLVLPSAIVLTAGDGSLELLFEKTGTVRKYKSEGLTLTDINEAVRMLRELGEHSFQVVKRELDSVVIFAIQHPYVYDQEYFELIERSKIQDLVNIHTDASNELIITEQGIELMDRLLQQDPNQPLKQAVRSEIQRLIAQTHLPEQFTAVSDEPTLLTERLIDLAVKEVEKKIVAVIKRLAVKSVLQEKGYQTDQFDIHALSSERVSQTAQKLGIASGKHADTPQDNLTDMQTMCISDADSNHEGEFDYNTKIDWERYNPNYDSIIVKQKPDAKTLRMLYDSGLLVARI